VRDIEVQRKTFVIGGCRSGKSGHALKLAESYELKRRVYIATCVPHDEEMRTRVERHQAERGDRWSTVEEPIRLPDVIRSNSSPDAVVVVDCLTLWVTNLVMDAEDRGMEHVLEPAQRLVLSLENARGPVVLVSNEVGTGIVPENHLARLFRDVAGSVNQRVAAVADTVIWMVAGIPVKVKPAH
jgi:adenosylcobinamide kinase/adenosylcobinamide-phosphate guanylyltransferase